MIDMKSLIRIAKKILGLIIVSSFAIFLIGGYGIMVYKEGWIDGLIKPISYAVGFGLLMGLGVWLLASSNKK